MIISNEKKRLFNTFMKIQSRYITGKVNSIEKLLTKEKVEEYNEKGFLVLPNVISHDVIDGIKQEAANLVNGVDSNDLKTKFDTGHDISQRNDNYFVESGDKVINSIYI